MVRLIKSFLFSFILLSVFSCEETREDKIVKYLQSKDINGNVSIGILNPNHCGSCTDYSISILCGMKNNNQSRIILSTSNLEPNYKSKLREKGYTFKTADEDELARVGITLAVCTFIVMKDNEVVNIQIIK